MWSIRDVRVHGGIRPGAHPKGELSGKVDSKPIARYNVAPGIDVQVMHVEAEGVQISPIHWGCKREISWPKPRIVRPINARIETIPRGRFYKPLFPDHRALIPAEGWYEWVRDDLDPDKNQPFFIWLKAVSPCSSLGWLRPSHARKQTSRPVSNYHRQFGCRHTRYLRAASRDALPKLAQQWLASDLSKDRAKAIATYCSQPVEDFEWYPVSKDVGNVHNKGEYLVKSVD